MSISARDGRICTVFGGTGFLGRSVVRAAHAAGFSVRIAARRPERASAAETGTGDERVAADVRDDDGVRRAVHGAAAVVNAVSLYTERPGVTFEQIHVAGAARVARAAREAGVESLVQISGLGADSASPAEYVRARGRGEAAVRDELERAVVLRPSVLFGRGDGFLAALSRVTRLPVVPLFGDGGTRLQPVHVDDVATAAAAAAADPRTAGRVYELGGPETLSYGHIVRLVMHCLGRCRPVVAVPFPVWLATARALALLPSPPLTRDQVVLMQHDNVVTGTQPTFAELGIEPAVFSASLERCL